MQLDQKNTTAQITASNFPSEILSITAAPSNMYQVTVTSANTSQGTVSGGGYCTSGMNVQIIATPKSNYAFYTWTENSKVVFRVANPILSITKKRNLVANFVNSSSWSLLFLGNEEYYKNVIWAVASDGTQISLIYKGASSGLVYKNFNHYSSDGSNFETYDLTTSVSKYLAYGNGKLITCVASSIYVSYNFKTFTQVTSLRYNSNGPVYDESNGFVVVGSSLTSFVTKSPDGINWSLYTPDGGIQQTTYKLAAGNGILIIIGDGSSARYIRYTSISNLNWKQTFPGTQNRNLWTALFFGKDKFILAKSGSVGYCTNGDNWVMSSNPPLGDWIDGAYGNDMYIMWSKDGKLAYSTDGITWKLSTKNLPSSISWDGPGVYGSNKFFVTSSSGYVASILKSSIS